MDELVSVIVPVYNVEQYLADCVNSILKQTYTNLEIILVDDGSADTSGLLCDKYKELDERIRVIHKQNGGLSDARNAGLEICRGQYIAFVDSDDWIESDYIGKMYEALGHEKADICVCGIIDDFEDTGKSVFSKREYFAGNTEQSLYRLYDQTKIPVSSWCKLYKRKIWANLRFPVGKLYEDAFTTCFAFDLAERIVQIPDGLYHYRIRQNSIMTRRFSLRNLDMNEAWRTNYQFCQERYPGLSNISRAFWLEHVGGLIRSFPWNPSEEELQAKKNLKKILRGNALFILTKMPIKKACRLVKECFQ